MVRLLVFLALLLPLWPGLAAADQHTQSPPANGCAIKGNINRTGERVYHVPGGQYYRSIRIDRERGERWFCSEEEARAAGWRKSKR